MRKFISEKFSTPGQTFDDKFPIVWTTAFEKIPVVIGIPNSLSCIPDSKAQDSWFYKEKFPHSGIQIPLHFLVSNQEGLVRVGLL